MQRLLVIFVKKYSVYLLFFLFILPVLPIYPAYGRQSQKEPNQSNYEQSSLFLDESSLVIEFLTYWNPKFKINNREYVDFGFGQIPVEFFSLPYTPRSGFAASFRQLTDKSFGVVGINVGLEYSASTAKIFWHTPDLGISYPTLSSTLGMVDFWLGIIYAPFKLDKFPVRPSISLDVGVLHARMHITRDDKEGSSDDNHFFIKFGGAVDIKLFKHIGLIAKYQLYVLNHSRFGAITSFTIEGDHSNPYQLSLGITINK